MIDNYNRIVIKFGTTTLFDNENKSMMEERIQNICFSIAGFMEEDKEIVVVSSGAVAMGKIILEDLLKELDELTAKQIAGGVGQTALNTAWQHAFAAVGSIAIPIVLQTPQLDDSIVIKSLEKIINNRMIPVINENIPLQSEHDNDQLAAEIAVHINANLLIIFSDINGIYTADPGVNPDARHIEIVKDLNDQIGSIAGNSISGKGTGGMITKLKAAAIAAKQGIPTIIANGNVDDPFDSLENSEKHTLVKTQAMY